MTCSWLISLMMIRESSIATGMVGVLVQCVRRCAGGPVRSHGCIIVPRRMPLEELAPWRGRRDDAGVITPRLLRNRGGAFARVLFGRRLRLLASEAGDAFRDFDAADVAHHLQHGRQRAGHFVEKVGRRAAAVLAT